MGRLRQKEATKRESFLKHAEVRICVFAQSICQHQLARFPHFAWYLKAASLGALALKLLQPAFCHLGVMCVMSNFLVPQGYVPRPVLGALGLLGQPAHCQISVPSSEAGLLAVTLEDIQNVPISAEVLAPAELLLVLSSACVFWEGMIADCVL